MNAIWNIGWRLKQRIAIPFLFAVTLIPLQQKEKWEVLSYRKVPPNKVLFSDSGVEIQVENSSSPIIYKLPHTTRMRALTVRGSWQGSLKVNENQGDSGQDDFVLRLGLVVEGHRRLGFMQKMLAPAWIKRLHELAPSDTGVDRIEYFNIVSRKSLVGRRRIHPSSEFLVENFVWLQDKPGNFELTHRFSAPLSVLAIWLSSDGDDTASKFSLHLKSLDIDVVE